MTDLKRTPISDAQLATLRGIAHGKTEFKMRGALTPEEQADYSAITALFERGLINPAARLKRGKSAFCLTPKGEAQLTGGG